MGISGDVKILKRIQSYLIKILVRKNEQCICTRRMEILRIMEKSKKMETIREKVVKRKIGKCHIACGNFGLKEDSE